MSRRLPPLFFPGLTAGLLAVGGAAAFAQTESSVDADLPQPLESGHFDQIMTHSPFVRTLNLSETYALRGIAEINGEQVATLYNRDTKKSILVTESQANAERMQLKSVIGGEDLFQVSATIAVAGEEVELKFEPERVAPLPKNPQGKGPSSSGGSSSGKDGERRGPSPQDIERYKSLPPEKQEKLREYIRQSMQSYPNMSREERGNLIRGAMTRLIDGGDITMPTPPSGSSTASPPPPPSSSSGSSSSSDRGRDRDRDRR